MKKILKTVLIIFLCIIILVGILTAWQWNNIKALFMSVKYSSEEIDALYKENAEKMDDILNGKLRDLSDDEKKLLLSGDLTEEQALAIIKDSDGNTNNTNYSERVYDLVAQIYLLRAEFTGALNNLESEAKGVYYSMPKEERTASNKVKYVKLYTTKAVELETQCDSKMESIIGEMETELKKNNNSMDLISEIREVYVSEKEIKKSQLLNKYSKYLQ